ncbi:hypothetical protein C0J52_13229 [Blattella germanica]|nr:hypothetical protein C0J52_13229 [Blattella germanica]
MQTITLLTLLTLLTYNLNEAKSVAPCNKILHVLNYLQNFGYLSVVDNQIAYVDTANLTNALLLFQEYYGLDPTGQINNAALKLINTPRCGVKDDVFSFSTTTYKWNKKTIKWHYVLANNKLLDLTQAAFDVWSKHADITFEHNHINPDITISNKCRVHKFQRSSTLCIYKFDGTGGVLAHAYYPGHSLGLGHSNDPNSVMYAFYTTDDIKLELQTDDI